MRGESLGNDFAHIAIPQNDDAAGRTGGNFDAEFDAARDHHDFAGLGIDAVEFGNEAQIALLQDEQYLTLCIVKNVVRPSIA